MNDQTTLTPGRRVRITLQADSGAGAFGAGRTFEQAHVRAWVAWRGNFGSATPVAAIIDASDGPRPGESVRACIAPPALDLAVASAPPATFDWDVAHHVLEDLDSDLGLIRTTAQQSAPSVEELHQARGAVVWAIRHLADVDATLAEQLTKRLSDD